MDKREFMQALFIAMATRPGVDIGSVKADWCAKKFDEIESECVSDWIEWGGGPCPVDVSTVVIRKYRDGIIGAARSNKEAGDQGWRHCNTNSDIIAYRVVTP